jgi:membrane protein DedA with SNARE-associated domain
MIPGKWILATIALVLIVSTVGWLIWNNQNFFISLIENYGYYGTFLVSLAGSSTVLVPLPFFVVIITAGYKLNPFFVGLSAGLGAAIGELTGYGLGFSGRNIIEKRRKKGMEKVEGLFQKYGGFLVIFLFAATPLPDDIVGILAGSLKYPLKKFFIASLIGKIIFNMTLAYAGSYGINWIIDIFRL